MPRTRRKQAVSLRVKILIISIIIAIVPTFLVSWILINSAKEKQLESFTNNIEEQVTSICDRLKSGDYFSDPDSSELNSVIKEASKIWNARIFITNESGQIVFDTENELKSSYDISEDTLASISGNSIKRFDKGSDTVIVSQPIYSGSETELAKPIVNLSASEDPEYQAKVVGSILVKANSESNLSALSEVNSDMYLLWIAFGIAIIIVAGIAISYLFIPFKKLQNEISEAVDGNINKVKVDKHAETSNIGDGVNAILKKLKVLDESKQEFVSNVSHELKTPITSMRVLADSINGMGDVPNETYKEFMEDISIELEREGQIIDDLLSMSRLEEGSAPLNLTEVNLNEWLEKTLRRLSPIAKSAKVELLFESFRPVSANIDENKLTLAVSNLVENSIKYNNENGFVKVSLNADHHYFFIKIEDSGIGIPEEAMPHLFERFFRVDKDRARETGGTGLGLSITKLIVNLHGGAIKAYSEIGEGSTFVIRIPLGYREKEDGNE